MQLLIDQLDINSCAGEIEKYLARFPSYVLQLQRQAAKCNFGVELEYYLHDRLITGINDAALQKKMLPEQRTNLQTSGPKILFILRWQSPSN